MGEDVQVSGSRSWTMRGAGLGVLVVRVAGGGPGAGFDQDVQAQPASCLTVSGVAATRRSPSCRSRGMPSFTRHAPLRT